MNWTFTIVTLVILFYDTISSMGFIKLEPGVHVKTLAENCQMEKFKIGPESAIMLESANFNTEYASKLSCKNLFMADGDCSLLMQCSDFELEKENSKGICKNDFFFVKDKNGKHKYCGSEASLRNSINFGKRISTRFKTNQNDNHYKGFKCQISCCPQEYLSTTQVQLDFRNEGGNETRSRSGELYQTCLNPDAPSPGGDSTCGVKGPVTKIVGGVTAEKYKFTWLAMLVRRVGKRRASKIHGRASSVIPDNMEPFCGGSLVSRYWIITASHCTLDGSEDKYRVVLGEWDRNHPTDTVVRVHELVKRIKHPLYNDRTYDNDIAMWKLATPADLHHFRTICLPVPGLQLKNPMTVAGWGVTREGDYQLSTILQEVNVPVVSSKACKASLGEYDITDNMLCAGGIKGQDACQGDSGGPLMGDHPDSNQTYLAGVVSWGLGCAREDLYGVYTKVSRYSDWIKHNIET